MWLKTHPNQQWDPNTNAFSIHILNDGETPYFILPCGGDVGKGGQWGCMYWAQNNGIKFLQTTVNFVAKDSDITPVSTKRVDTLWCPPEEGRTTSEQVGFRNPEGNPDPASGADVDDYVDTIMADQDEEFPF
jgi:hypothetical protein